MSLFPTGTLEAKLSDVKPLEQGQAFEAAGFKFEPTSEAPIHWFKAGFIFRGTASAICVVWAKENPAERERVPAAISLPSKIGSLWHGLIKRDYSAEDPTIEVYVNTSDL